MLRIAGWGRRPPPSRTVRSTCTLCACWRSACCPPSSRRTRGFSLFVAINVTSPQREQGHSLLALRAGKAGDTEFSCCVPIHVQVDAARRRADEGDQLGNLG